MGTEDLIDLPPTSEADCQASNSEITEGKIGEEILGYGGEVGNEDGQPLLETESEKDLGDNLSMSHVTVTEEENYFSSGVHTENGCLTVRDGSPSNNHKRDGSPISKHELSISGAKRARMTVAEQQPLVRVQYESLTRNSKQKLEELLQQWSGWHTQHCSSAHESNEALESGEDTYFPALHVGLDKPSAVSFWMDNQTRNERSKEFIPVDSNSVPLYDRGYSLALTSADGFSNLEGDLGVVDSRCFNCGSYNHALKECPKPRDNAAVNNARKQHNQSKRKQNTSSRNPTRYYQNSPGGKYDGLRPGVLGAETRQLLGLGDFDPPPWLNRMREIGYPPGYLDPEDEDQPSGITIFGDEQISVEKEDGEILETGDLELPSNMSVELLEVNARIRENANETPKLPRKMSIEFPGINAPIPEHADEWRWAAGPSSYNRSSRRPNRRSTYASSEPVSKDPYREQRWSRDYRDEGPPGCDPVFSPTLSSHAPRYGGYESNYSSNSARGNNQVQTSPSFGRSMSDRGRWSPSVHEGSSNHGSHSSLPFSPPHRLPSPNKYGSGSFENQDDDSRDYLARDSSSHRTRRR